MRDNTTIVLVAEPQRDMEAAPETLTTYSGPPVELDEARLQQNAHILEAVQQYEEECLLSSRNQEAALALLVSPLRQPLQSCEIFVS